MGLFSSRTQTYVASSLWDMTGGDEDAPPVLKTIVMSSILSGSTSVAQSIQDGLRNSTVLRTATFFQWARQHYALGLPDARLGAEVSVTGQGLLPALRSALRLNERHRLRILSSRIDDADLSYWAEAWVILHRPALGVMDWTVRLDRVTSELVIQLPEEVVRIPAPADLLWGLAARGRKILFVVHEVQERVQAGANQGLWVSRPTALFTYRMGTGNETFDALIPAQTNLAEFYPAIPVRLDNGSVAERSDFGDLAKAYRRLTGASFEELVDQIDEHENRGDMDHVFVVPGVSLNTKNEGGLAYLYLFFQELARLQQLGESRTDFIQREGQGIHAQAHWLRWLAGNMAGTGSSLSPVYGADPTEGRAYVTLPDRNVLRVSMPEMPELDMRVSWNRIEETQHLGNMKRFDGVQREMAKRGSFWMVPLRDVRLQVPAGLPEGLQTDARLERVALLHQYSRHRYRMLTISRLEHRNYVYGDHAAYTSAGDALADQNPSSFLVPMHYPTLRKLSQVQKAELAKGGVFLVVNSVEHVRQRWWQRGWFRVVAFLGALAFSVVTAGGSLAAAGGLLGTNAAVGAMLGASAATAAIVGAVANTLAGLVLTSVIFKGAIKIFGEKWGAVISAVVSFVALSAGASMSMGQPFDVAMQNLMRPENLLKLSDSVTGAAANWMQADTLGLQEAMTRAGEENAREMEELTRRAEDILGSSTASFDVMLLTDAPEHFGETSAVFLDRTLMTGSDLAAMSLQMIEGFADLALELPGMA